MQGVDGYSGSSNSAPAGCAAAGSLAYHALTNGANTTITSRFGKRKGSSKVSSNHTGLDIDAKMGTPLYAPESGRVTQSKHEMGGLQAHLTGKSGVVYGLAHLSSVNAKGEVKAGDLIAKSGNSGKGTTAPHIHLSITHNNKKVNPEGFRIPKRKGSNDSGGAKGIGGTGNDNGAKHAEFGISESSPAAASMRSNVSAVSGGKTYETAAGFSALTSSTGPSVESSLSSSPGISAAKRSSVKSSSPQSASSNASSKAGSIEGKTPNIKDPRGALNQDVMQAATSPLFV
jgi:murein DD-endopeptidase MepM/ murein hydrolase activator NlpD